MALPLSSNFIPHKFTLVQVHIRIGSRASSVWSPTQKRNILSQKISLCHARINYLIFAHNFDWRFKWGAKCGIAVWFAYEHVAPRPSCAPHATFIQKEIVGRLKMTCNDQKSWLLALSVETIRFFSPLATPHHPTWDSPSTLSFSSTSTRQTPWPQPVSFQTAPRFLMPATSHANPTIRPACAAASMPPTALTLVAMTDYVWVASTTTSGARAAPIIPGAAQNASNCVQMG